MTLKEKFLSITDINKLTMDENILFHNELDWSDKEILNHYNFLRKNIDLEKADKEFEKKIISGFEIPELLRKNKKS